MADYRGVTAPIFVLYSDGQLLAQNSIEGTSWYQEKQINKEEMTTFLNRIEKTGFFSSRGDGGLWEEDPIYQFPDDFIPSFGAGTLSLQAHKDDLSKQVTIYIPYREHLVPEISKALKLVEEYQPTNMKSYYPEYWVVWVSKKNPCSFYDIQYRSWPEVLPGIRAYIGSQDEARLVLQSTHGLDLRQFLGLSPNTFLYKNSSIYYIYTRPLLPHELPSDFCDQLCDW